MSEKFRVGDVVICDDTTSACDCILCREEAPRTSIGGKYVVLETLPGREHGEVNEAIMIVEDTGETEWYESSKFSPL